MRLAALPGLLALGRIFRHPMGRVGASLVLAFAVIAIFTPLIAPYDPALQDFDELMPPDPSHWLGTDQFGRDVLSRVLYASRVALLVGCFAAALGGSVGVAVGLLAGYFQGWIDASSDCPTSATDPRAYDSDVCLLQRFSQNLLTNPPVNDLEAKALMGISLGAMASCCGPVAVPLQLGWGALTPLIVSYAVTHSSAPASDLWKGLGESALNVEAEYGGHSLLPLLSGQLLGSIEDTYKVIAAAATAYPPMRSILPSLAILGNDYAGNSYLIFPNGFEAVKVPAAQGSYDSTQWVVPPGQAYLLSVAVSGTGVGSVSSFPFGIACGSACSASYPAGTTVLLAADAAGTSLFQGWTGACTGTGPCVVTMNSDVTVAAAIAPPPPDNACCMGYFDAYCTVYGPGGCWRDFASTYVNGVCQAPASGYPGPWIATPGPCNCDPALYVVCSP